MKKIDDTAIAIIPARSGSKRLPDKNIRRLADIPLLVRAIQSAQESKCFTHIYVDTDSEDYADLALQAGAEVPFLRDEYRDDYSPVSLTTSRFVSRLQESGVSDFFTVVQLMANCPLRRASDIQKHVQHFREIESAFQISGFSIGFVNPWWAHVVAENGVATPLFPKVCAKRSQDLDKTLIPTGAIWIADSAKLVSQQTFYGTGFTMCELNWISAVDIDDEEDWKFAEFALRVRSEGLSL